MTKWIAGGRGHARIITHEPPAVGPRHGIGTKLSRARHETLAAGRNQRDLPLNAPLTFAGEAGRRAARTRPRAARLSAARGTRPA